MNKTLCKEIGRKVWNLRKSSGLSFKDLVKLSGVAQGNVSKIENGKSNPTISTLSKIAKGLGCPITTLLEGK